MDFEISSAYKPTGDQPQAIETLVQGLKDGEANQVLLGVTGSGKTFTMANIIQAVQRPTLVIAHNKTLAAQLCSEFKQFFPNNAVEYFVSYYDFYQPEAYIPSSDTYIEKESQINEEIDRLRHSATASLLERRDVIVVASVSCIYPLGAPEEYRAVSFSAHPGQRIDRDAFIRRLVEIQYERNDIDFTRGTFRVRGDVVEVCPPNTFEQAVRVAFFGDEIEKITLHTVLTGAPIAQLDHVVFFPTSHYATSREKIERAIVTMEEDMASQVKLFEEQGKLIEAQRITQRTQYDIEMMREVGYCSGIENYSRYFDGRQPGQSAYTLLSFFPKDYLVFMDESHVTLSQVRSMSAGDRSRKDMLVQYGFRLPSAYDNRPLTGDEFEERVGQRIFVSATPGKEEMRITGQIAQQIIRPTGLLDPPIEVRPAAGQVDDLLGEIRKEVSGGHRVLALTLTKRMAENLTDYLKELDINVKYLHSDIDTLERSKILRELRLGEFDVLVGINLLREGIDLPEVTLVAILDADKEGFLRSETSLIQTIGRAARNVLGHVVMYADKITDSMQRAMDETERRRSIQMKYNKEHSITPQTIIRAVHDPIAISRAVENEKDSGKKRALVPDANRTVAQVEKEMLEAAALLDFETAAMLRDELMAIKKAKKKGK